MTAKNKRMDERFACEVTVDLVWNRQRSRLRTVDVGYRGLFLRTDTPPNLRQLLRLEVPLPDGEVLVIHGMAVHVLQIGDPSPNGPGVGVQFYAVDKDCASRWGRFVDGVRKRGAPVRIATDAELESPRYHDGAPGEPNAQSVAALIGGEHKGPSVASAARPRLGSTAGPSPAEPVRRRFPRYDAELELEVRSMEELQHLVTRDVSAGGMFIATEAPIAPGVVIRIVVRHPQRTETFDLDAVVRHNRAAPMGIGVEFVGLDAARRAELMEFIRPSLPLEDILVVEVGDPNLV